METPLINVISLPERADRKKHIIQEFKEQGIEKYEFWEGVKHDLPFVGIQRAHKQIVLDAKNKGLTEVCIAEDDLSFPDIGAWNYFIESVPESYNLFLSSIYWGIIKEDNTVEDFSSLTLYLIHSSYYDTFLSTPENQHIDRGQKGRGKFVVCNPFTSFQIEGYSDNVKRETDYFQQYMKGRVFYSQARSVAANKDLIAASL